MSLASVVSHRRPSRAAATTAVGDDALTGAAGPRKRIPPNLFGIGFGLAGLGAAWQVTEEAHHTPTAVTTVLLVVAAASWLAVLLFYMSYVAAVRTALLHDLADHAAAPFLSLAVITPMLLSARLLYPHSQTVGRAAVDVFLVLTVVLGGWLTGDWIYRPLVVDDLHPGYFLPTVAGGLIAAASAAAVGQHRLAVVMFGLGLFCWVILGAVIMNRLFTRPLPPDRLLPTLAVEVAPPAVASIAWFAMHGAQVDAVAELFGGYLVLMALAQLRLLPAYLRLPFQISTWAFTFSWAAAAGTALEWLQILHPAGYRAGELAVLALITLLVGAIAARTLAGLARGDLLPAPSPHPDASSHTTSH